MKYRIASIAQLVELLICNQQVGGSSPSAGSKSFVHFCRRSSLSRLRTMQDPV